jgi:hypothetical protein
LSVLMSVLVQAKYEQALPELRAAPNFWRAHGAVSSRLFAIERKLSGSKLREIVRLSHGAKYGEFRFNPSGGRYAPGARFENIIEPGHPLPPVFE